MHYSVRIGPGNGPDSHFPLRAPCDRSAVANGGGVAETEEAEEEEKGDWKKTSRISCLVSPFAVVEGGRRERSGAVVIL